MLEAKFNELMTALQDFVNGLTEDEQASLFRLSGSLSIDELTQRFDRSEGADREFFKAAKLIQTFGGI